MSAEIEQEESRLLVLSSAFMIEKRDEDLRKLVPEARKIASSLSRVKGAKLIKALVENYLLIDSRSEFAVGILVDCIQWATEEERTFLRKSLEVRLMLLYYERKEYTEALNLGANLIIQLKKINDSDLLVRVYLLESKCYLGLDNLEKSKTALNLARVTAYSIYIPPTEQAEIDMHSGILSTVDSKDFNTAFSYFFEAFDIYDNLGDMTAGRALKYMLLCKIMLEQNQDIPRLMSGEVELNYNGPETACMLDISRALTSSSLNQFMKTVSEYSEVLEQDPVVLLHLEKLQENMMEQNLIKILKPYSRVQVQYVADKIDLPVLQVERRLSKMILDKKLSGILDQENGVIILFSRSTWSRTDTLWELGNQILEQLHPILDKQTHILNNI